MRSAVSGSRMQPRERQRQRDAREHAQRVCAMRAHRVHRSSRSVRHEDVALVADGPDEPRMLGIGLDLLAQPHDRADRRCGRTDPSRAAGSGSGCARATARRLGCSASAFSRSNSSGDIAHLAALLVGEPVRGDVEHAAADAHALRRRCSARPAADVRRSTLLTRATQLARIERLRHVVVGAHLEADDAVDDGRRRTSA